jgi:hypothetical protein
LQKYDDVFTSVRMRLVSALVEKLKQRAEKFQDRTRMRI